MNHHDIQPDATVHGFDGPLAVSAGRHDSKPADIVAEVCKAAESLGYPLVPDLQDLKQSNGFSVRQLLLDRSGTMS